MTFQSTESRTLTREQRAEQLAVADVGELLAIADRVIAATPESDLHISRPPQVGTVVAQVREPIARQRYYLADVLVAQAEVVIDGHTGWGMRIGDDRRAAIAQAVLDAEVQRGGAEAEAIEHLIQATWEQKTRTRADRWERLVPTIVEFEEIP